MRAIGSLDQVEVNYRSGKKCRYRNQLNRGLCHDKKLEPRSVARIPIDDGGLTDLVDTLVASALSYGLPVVTGVVCSVCISAKIPTSAVSLI